MHITDVIRAEEWISSTPKHVLLYNAFGWELPKFWHMPLLRNPDKSKISKRKNPVSLIFYQQSGYLPQAMLNFPRPPRRRHGPTHRRRDRQQKPQHQRRRHLLHRRHARPLRLQPNLPRRPCLRPGETQVAQPANTSASYPPTPSSPPCAPPSSPTTTSAPSPPSFRRAWKLSASSAT